MEVTNILTQTLPHIVINSHNIELPELQGEPQSVCYSKTKYASQQLPNTIILVDDTSLCYNSLNGLPGVYIKDFLHKLGHTGLNDIIDKYADKSAVAQCIFGLCKSSSAEPILFTGQCQGTIVQPRGDTTFGWDPIFQPHGHSQTYAEMNKTIKNQISHRSDALNKLARYLHDHPQFFD